MVLSNNNLTIKL
uniref:Uncharacterized protein n=1 Tax=Rhizophora mucronata TaxID=61149 RepID=A0A2P2P1A9_RHIMU